MKKVFVCDPTLKDKQSSVRGIGRYLQILKENFPHWIFTDKISTIKQSNHRTIFINPFFNFLQTPLLMKRIAQKQIAIIHDLIPLKYSQHFPIGVKGKLNVFLNKLALKNYDRIITDSEASKKDIMKILGIKEEKIKVIYPCLPKIFTESQKSEVILSFPRRRESRLKLPGKDTIIDWIPSYEGMTTSNFCVYVGDATWNKNLVNLAKAIKILNVPCVFVGEIFKQAAGHTDEKNLEKLGEKVQIPFLRQSLGFPFRVKRSKKTVSSFFHPWQKELREFLQEIGNDKRFILKGFVSDKELIQLYQQAKVNVLPSRDEGFGFSFLEAASQRCPSVLADIPVLREISNGQALFANPNNPHEIANAIGEIFFNGDVRKKIGDQTYKRSLFFQPLVFKKQLLALL